MNKIRFHDERKNRERASSEEEKLNIAVKKNPHGTIIISTGLAKKLWERKD